MLRKIYLIWRYLGRNNLNVGCGDLKIKYCINIDMNFKNMPDIVADGRCLPFKDKVFDVAFAFDVIEHVPNPDKFVLELERVARNVVIECLDFDKCRDNWCSDPTHVFYFNEKIFKSFFEKRGYKCFKLEGYGNIRLKDANMLVAVKKPKIFNRLGWWIFFYLSKIIKLIRGNYIEEIIK